MSRSARLLGGFWIFAGTMHFVRPQSYRAIMPWWVPAHHEMVLASGAAEIVGGIGAFAPSLRKPVRWWLIGVLVAIFPANVQMAVHPDDIEGLPDIPRWLLWARLPLQAVLIAWVVRATREH
jgi:uncharacterized membrane protein